MPDIDYIAIRPESPGWTLWIYTEPGRAPQAFTIGDVIQFQQEVERTLGRWLADGPADFHGPAHIPKLAGPDHDLARDIERGK